MEDSVHTSTPEPTTGPVVAGGLVTILVNEHEVTVPRLTTGLGIKEAAISQGVKIQTDFILSEERPNGTTKIIGDAEEVRVHPGSRFVAIPNDDNS